MRLIARILAHFCLLSAFVAGEAQTKQPDSSSIIGCTENCGPITVAASSLLPVPNAMFAQTPATKPATSSVQTQAPPVAITVTGYPTINLWPAVTVAPAKGATVVVTLVCAPIITVQVMSDGTFSVSMASNLSCKETK